MNDFNIGKLDSKGRLLIPFYIRDYLDLNEDSKLMMINNGKKELKLIPIVEGQNAKIKLQLKDIHGSLAEAAKVISGHNIDILMSKSKTIEKGKLAEWEAVIDTADFKKDLKELESQLNDLKIVKSVKITEQ